jgi:hypothetical protein
MNKATQNGGFDLRHRTAKLITVMAAAILSIVILVGCPNEGGPGPTPTVTDVEVILIPQETTTVTKGIPLQFGAKVFWSDNTVTTITPEAVAENADQIRQYVVFTITSTIYANDPTTGTRISDTGLLIVALSETADTITVKGAYKDNTNLYREKTLTVNEGTATVTSISINGDASVNKGSSILLTAAVDTSPTNADKSVTWSIETSGIASGTSLSSTALSSVTLTVDASESNTSIIVKIVSNLDESKIATKTVYVNEQLSPTLDFTTAANANLLGLYPEGNYDSGDDLIDAMEIRATNAKFDPEGPFPAFYNPSTPIDLTDYGITDAKRGGVDGAAPAMAWYINSNNQLIVHGSATSGASIKFDVAVINAVTGAGWVTTTPYEEAYDIYAGRNTEIDLTGTNSMTKLPNLTGYKVYIIVRWTNDFSNERDLNDEHDFYNDRNVIDITPTSP